MKEMILSLDNYTREELRGFRNLENLDNQHLSEPIDFSIALEPTWPMCIPDNDTKLLEPSSA